MILPNAPAMLSPAARNLIAGRVIAARVSAGKLHTLQETLDDVFLVDCIATAWKAGERAARALRVGDTFTGARGASIAFYGSDPNAPGQTLPIRARHEHKAFREGFQAALPQIWTGETTRIVLMRRAAPRTRGKDKGGFVVLEQTTPGEWKPVRMRGELIVYRSEGVAKDAARYRPARTF